MNTDKDKPEISIEPLEKGRIRLKIRGSWTVKNSLPPLENLFSKLEKLLPLKEIELATDELTKWDSTFVLFLIELKNFAQDNQIKLNLAQAPAGALHLLELARKGKSISAPKPTSPSLFAQVGLKVCETIKSIKGFHEFLGSIVLGIFNVIAGKARFRFSDFMLYTQEAGAMALPIISLVSFLVGLILAFVATVQLKMFGAQIFVADLVGIAMARDMGAMMVGIIMAGRTGATYAAQIGTMQVNEEIDALKTLGLKPIEFLVLPRIFALSNDAASMHLFRPLRYCRRGTCGSRL